MKKIYCVLMVVIIVLSFCSCGKKSFDNMSVKEKVDYILDNMTLEEKIAQMLIVYYTDDNVDDTLLNVIKTVKPGGFILSSENITTYSKTKNFVSTLQENSEIPMIISIDQEGGLVQRMSNLTEPSATNIPDMYSIGSSNDYDLAKSIGKVMAEEMRTIGVNTVFAPVVDIVDDNSKSFIGNRSFGSSVEVVSKMAVNIANGFEKNGVIATYKHFPGHGDTTIDSHTELPIIKKSLEELKKKELVPFESAIKNGAKIIMVGHIALPEITGDNIPASLSKTIVTDLLKSQMGYDGLVITDALNMGALTKTYSYEEIYVKAIEAGCDLLLMPNGSKKAIEIIKSNIHEERIDESVKKILTFKYENLNDYKWLDKSYIGSDTHKSIVDNVHVHDFKDATCNTPKTCSCGEIVVGNHAYNSSGICDTCGKIQDNVVEVKFNDLSLENLIRQELSIYDERAITNLDMQRLKQSFTVASRVKDISGLEYAVNLEHLTLDNCYITNSEKLGKLSNLKSIIFFHGVCDDVSFMKNLNNIEDINLYVVQGGDNRHLVSSPKLKRIYLNCSDINLEFLTYSKSIEEIMLYVYDEEMNIAPILELPSLKRITVDFLFQSSQKQEKVISELMNKGVEVNIS